MKRIVIVKVYFEKKDKEKYLKIMSVRQWAKALGISPTYMFEMLNGEKPMLEKYFRRMEEHNETI